MLAALFTSTAALAGSPFSKKPLQRVRYICAALLLSPSSPKAFNANLPWAMLSSAFFMQWYTHASVCSATASPFLKSNFWNTFSVSLPVSKAKLSSSLSPVGSARFICIFVHTFIAAARPSSNLRSVQIPMASVICCSASSSLSIILRASALLIRPNALPRRSPDVPAVICFCVAAASAWSASSSMMKTPSRSKPSAPIPPMAAWSATRDISRRVRPGPIASSHIGRTGWRVAAGGAGRGLSPGSGP
mmetsp:Transcript_115266/g.326591  ORF Transcript_115266/g.326591 Transcript_115266/m.326591 type:complete len:247 (+) Transcript_115266:687-1427(+)